MDEEELQKAAASRDEGWLRRSLERLRHPQCTAAVRWMGDERWYMPCGHPPKPRERFCWVHGGSTASAARAELLRRHAAGETFARLAKDLHVSRQRVHQIVQQAKRRQDPASVRLDGRAGRPRSPTPTRSCS